MNEFTHNNSNQIKYTTRARTTFTSPQPQSAVITIPSSVHIKL